MRIRTPLLVTAVAATMLAGAALPALADGTGTPTQSLDGAPGASTATTFTLTGGPLSVTINSAATLTPGAPGDEHATGTLGTVDVSDMRGSTANWVVSAVSTTFKTGAGDAPGLVSTTDGVSYSAGTAGALATNKTSGAVTATSAGPTTIDTVVTPGAVVAGEANGVNTASWDPTLTVSLPSTAHAGDWTGTVTTSIT